MQGVGADRCLHIRPAHERQEGDGDAGGPAHGHRRVSPHVREVWNWCQEEGGRFWGYSQVCARILGFQVEPKRPLVPRTQGLNVDGTVLII